MTVGLHRITQRMLVDTSTTQLHARLGELASVQEQISTRKVINRPSDSPTDTATVLRLRSSIAAQEQYARSAQDGVAWAGLIDQTLGGVGDQLRRARELTLQGVSDSSPQASRDAIALEIEQIRDQLLTEANTTYLDRPVFGGTTAGRQAYDEDGTYVGSPGHVVRAVGDSVRVRVDTPGPEVFGDGAGSVFAELDELVLALRTGDQPAMRAGLDTLAARMDVVAQAQAVAGTTYNRLERAGEKARESALDLTGQLSGIEDTDLAEASIELSVQEVAYQAALAATARVVQPSLVAFLT